MHTPMLAVHLPGWEGTDRLSQSPALPHRQQPVKPSSEGGAVFSMTQASTWSATAARSLGLSSLKMEWRASLGRLDSSMLFAWQFGLSRSSTKSKAGSQGCEAGDGERHRWPRLTAYRAL